MTIAVSLKVNDGVVLAADSATALIGQSPDGSIGVVNFYNNANKRGAAMRPTTSVTARLQDAIATKGLQFREVTYNFQPALLPVCLTIPGHHLRLTLGRLTPPHSAGHPFDTTGDPAERDYQQGRTGRGSERGASQAWFWTPE